MHLIYEFEIFQKDRRFPLTYIDIRYIKEQKNKLKDIFGGPWIYFGWNAYIYMLYRHSSIYFR